MNIYSINNHEKLHATSTSLNRRFADSDIKILPGRGGGNKYVEGNAVIDRLNEAFSPLGWSFSCRDVESFGDITQSKQIAVYGEITVNFHLTDDNGNFIPVTVTKGQWGSRAVKSDDSGAAKMEYGDDLKSASTDALKKCATMFGIGNHLYRKPFSGTVSPLIKGYASALDNLAKDKNMNRQQLLDFCSGVAHKTIESSADLTITQAQVCLNLLKDMPSLPDSDKAAVA